MNESDEERRSEVTAYHEAGHAVAFYLLHKKFKYVTISPKGEIVYQERKHKEILKKLQKRRIPSERDLKLLKRDYMISLAGPIAEGIMLKKFEYEDIRPLLYSHSGCNEREQRIDESLWRLYFEETKLLIYAPWNWHAIGALADELEKKKKIRYKEARKIIRNAIEDYQGAVKSGVAAVDPGYLDFVKRVEERKARRKEAMRRIHLNIVGRHRSAC